MTSPNATILKFGYPETVVADLDSWVVLVRPQQPTLGSLVLACKEPATAFAALSPAAMAALHPAVSGIERVLKAAFDYDKINYLMLMMVDPHVHFHVIPRYASERSFAGLAFRDAGWPRPPDLGSPHDVPAAEFKQLIDELRSAWHGDRT